VVTDAGIVETNTCNLKNDCFTMPRSGIRPGLLTNLAYFGRALRWRATELCRLLPHPALDGRGWSGNLSIMFLQFFTSLRDAQVPVTLREYLTLMEALDADLADQSVENFYYLSRAALVKDERNLDKFDRVFGTVFKGLESLLDAMEKAEIPAEWLKKLAEKYLTEEEKKQIEAMGWDKLMETLRKRLEEQKERHQGGNKWIGTAGTSPFGAEGYNPEASGL